MSIPQSFRGKPHVIARSGLPRRVADYVILTKPGITFMVTLSTLAGFLAGRPAAIQPGLLIWTVLGTSLLSAGAATMNMLWERREDSQMARTRTRPLPAGRLTNAEAALVGLLCGTAGVAMLSTMASPVAAALAGLSFLLYVLAYTPLKKMSRLSVVVGAVCGAIPPLVGSVASVQTITASVWVLFAAMFLWQFPHVAAIHFMQQSEFRRAGFLTLADDATPPHALAAYTLIPAGAIALCGLIPFVFGVGGAVLLLGAGVFSAFLWKKGIAYVRVRTHASARRLFFASLIFLPAFFAIMMMDIYWRVPQ